MGGAGGWSLNPTTAHARRRQSERGLPPEALVPGKGSTAVVVGQRVVTVLPPSAQKPTYLPGSFSINATLFGPRTAASQLFREAMVFRAEGGGGSGGGGGAPVRVDIAGCEGLVIGKGAAAIKALVQAHRVDVTIDGTSALIASTLLEGCDVAGARAAIESTCCQGRVPPGEPVVVAIAEGAVGRVIGRGGSVVKGLMARHRVSIQVVKGAAHIRPLQDNSDVQGACREVSAIAGRKGGRGGGGGQGDVATCGEA